MDGFVQEELMANENRCICVHRTVHHLNRRNACDCGVSLRAGPSPSRSFKFKLLVPSKPFRTEGLNLNGLNNLLLLGSGLGLGLGQRLLY